MFLKELIEELKKKERAYGGHAVVKIIDADGKEKRIQEINCPSISQEITIKVF